MARCYDLDLLDDPGDLSMYVGLAAANPGAVLELAVGTGRIGVALAAAGYDVTGVDRDPEMLLRARQAWARRQNAGNVEAGGALDLIEADVLDLDLGRRFSLVILALNSLLLLGDDAAKKRALTTMARHLTENGRAVMDVWLPTGDDLALYDGQVMLDWIRHDEETGQRVAKSWWATYDPDTRRANVTTYFDVGVDAVAGSRTVREDEVWFVSAQELVGLAKESGLQPETVAGAYELGASTGQSERLVLICGTGT